MKFERLLMPAVFALSSTAFLAQVARSEELPNPDQVYIKSISALGSGCEASTYNANLSDDKKAFTLTFSEFVAELGPGIPLSEARKNCSITLTLAIPAGFQYSVGTFNYRGFMDLAPRVQAEHNTNYFFQGTGKTGSFSAKVQGPVAKDFVYTDKVGLTSVYIPDTWSPCNVDRALTINPSIRLQKLSGAAADVQSIITNDSVDGELKQVFGLVYRRCGEVAPTPPAPPTPPTPPTPPAPVAPVVGETYQLISRHSGLCLDVLAHGLGNGVLLEQWACTGEPHQKFKIADRGNGYFALVGVESGKTVSVKDSIQANEAPVHQWDDFWADNQKVKFSPSVDGSFTVRFKHSNKCMDVSGPSTANGALVHQYECYSNLANQDWIFKK